MTLFIDRVLFPSVTLVWSVVVAVAVVGSLVDSLSAVAGVDSLVAVVDSLVDSLATECEVEPVAVCGSVLVGTEPVVVGPSVESLVALAEATVAVCSSLRLATVGCGFGQVAAVVPDPLLELVTLA